MRLQIFLLVSLCLYLCQLGAEGRTVIHRRRHANKHYATKVLSDSNDVVDTPPYQQQAVLNNILVPIVKETGYEAKFGDEGDEVASNAAIEENKCRWLVCGAGQMCVMDNMKQERCVCAEAGFCPPGHGMVCGSDGRLYDSHCELHRAACITDSKIYVDKRGEACLQKDLLMSKIKQSHKATYEAEISKKKDLSMSTTSQPSKPVLEKTEELMKESKKDEVQVMNGKPPAEPGVADERAEVKPEELCYSDKLEEFKDLLMVYHCNRLGLSNCVRQDSTARASLVAAMFRYYDRDYDNIITKQELEYGQAADHLQSIAKICSLPELLIQDLGGTGKVTELTELDLSGFYNVFSHSFEQIMRLIVKSQHTMLKRLLIGNFIQSSVPTLIKLQPESTSIYRTLEPKTTIKFNSGVKTTTITADGYEGVELICPLEDSLNVAWNRNGIRIDIDNTDGFSLMSRSRLYISSVNLEHTGNYTCHYVDEQDKTNTQQLIVQVQPVIRTLKVGKVMEGVSTPLRCHSDGVPEPVIEWQVAQYKLPNDAERFEWTNENTTVYIMSPSTKIDSAQYECLAKSPAGWAVSKTDVQVETQHQFSKDSTSISAGQYIVFHANGYTTYEAEHCYTTHSVDKHVNDFIHHNTDGVETLSRLCPHNEPCQWGDAVVVKNGVVYVTQPNLNRVLVIDPLDNFRPKHVMVFENPVKSLHYIPHNDELWILTGSQSQFQYVTVLSKASQEGSVDIHPLLPQHTVFDAVEELFAPAVNSFNRTSRYVYTRRFNQHGMSRIDTVSMASKGWIDTSFYNCQPQKVHFLAIGGLAIVECKTDSDGKLINLLIDTLTNSILKPLQDGKVYVSPNTRWIVFTNDERNISVYKLHDNASIEHVYNHKVQIKINHIEFMDSKRSAGYDIAITSSDENGLLFVDLKTLQSELLEGLLSGRHDTKPSESVPRLVSTSGEFGYHIMVPSQGALFIVNKQYHLIACEWTNLVNMQAVAFLNL